MTLYFGLQNDETPVFITLLDAGIYTMVSQKTMNEKNMLHGCFLDFESFDDITKVIDYAYNYIKRHNLKFVSASDFINIEKQNEMDRVRKAFSSVNNRIAKH